MFDQEQLGLQNFIVSFEFLGQFASRYNHIIWQKSVDNFEIVHKTCPILVWCALPLYFVTCTYCNWQLAHMNTADIFAQEGMNIIVTQRQLMRLSAVKLILSYE